MFNQLTDKEKFADQIYQKYLESSYLVQTRYDDSLIENLSLSIEVINLGFNLNECINDSC